MDSCSVVPWPWLTLLSSRKTSDLLDAEGDELRRPDNRDADQTDQPTVLDVIGSHCRQVTADEECVARFDAEERAVGPLRHQEGSDAVGHPAPGVGVVRLEHYPLSTIV